MSCLAEVDTALSKDCHRTRQQVRRKNLKVNNMVSRDVVVAYWARLTALQKGLEIDKSSPEALAILLPLMEWLESQKKVGGIAQSFKLG